MYDYFHNNNVVKSKIRSCQGIDDSKEKESL